MSFTGAGGLVTTVARLQVPEGPAGDALPLPAGGPAGLPGYATGPRSTETVTWSSR